MHALVLIVNLVATASSFAPELHLAADLTLAQSPDEAAAPAPAPPGLASSPRRDLRTREWAAASALTLAGDAVFVTMVVDAWSNTSFWPDSTHRGNSGPELAAGALGYAIVSPMLTIWGARLGGAPPDHKLAAYGCATVWRFLSGLAALDLRSTPELAVAVWAVSEVIVMPYIVTRMLADAPEPEPEGEAALALALPVRDPALGR